MTDINELRTQAEKDDADAQYRFAMALWKDENTYGQAREWFQKAADQGYAEAQYIIGNDFTDGENSRPMLLAAAEQGHAAACMALCYYYVEFGSEEAEGVRWYRRGIERGHAHDLTSLGIFDYGFDVVLSGTYEEAVVAEERDAKRGWTSSQYRVATYYAVGTPPYPVDVIQAYAWFAVCGDRGVVAKRRLAGVMDKGELEEAQLLAAEYVERYGRTPGLWSLHGLTTLVRRLWE